MFDVQHAYQADAWLLFIFSACDYELDNLEFFFNLYKINQ